MEYLIALLILAVTVAYAVFIAVNIEKGKSWAVDIAWAISMLDPGSIDQHPGREFRERLSLEEQPEPTAEKVVAKDADRLAA